MNVLELLVKWLLNTIHFVWICSCWLFTSKWINRNAI